MSNQTTQEKRLFDRVKDNLEKHYPTGWGGSAGVLLADGTILTSISPDFPNAASSVCMELGAYLQAANLDKKTTHSLCLVRENEKSAFRVLTPCGICQERLNFWGDQVLCAVEVNQQNLVKYLPLKELQPHHWLTMYREH